MKKILLGATLSALTLTTAAFAGGPDHMAMPVQHNSGHFFIGAAAGMGMLDASQTASLTQSYIDTALGAATQTVSESSDIGSNSFLGGLLLGYGTVFSNDFYVAVAGNALYNSLNSSVHSVTSTQTGFPSQTITGKLKNTFQGGADLRLGMRIDSVIPYILGGFEAGSWKYSTNFASVSKTLWAPKVGVGVLFDIAPQWNAGLEYAYSWFGNLSSNFTGAANSTTVIDSTGTTVSATPSASNTFKINQNQVLASINYLF